MNKQRVLNPRAPSRIFSLVVSSPLPSHISGIPSKSFLILERDISLPALLPSTTTPCVCTLLMERLARRTGASYKYRTKYSIAQSENTLIVTVKITVS